MALLSKTPLEDRIRAIQAEIDAIIDAKVEAEAKQCPGVPVGVLRNLITAKGGGCQCRQYLEIKKQDDAAKERESAA
jgi:hypothetical protein